MTAKIAPSQFVTEDKLIKHKWTTDLFVSNDQLIEILDEEKIEGNNVFEEKTGMSRETLWHVRNGESRYMPLDKADYILTKMGSVNRFNELAVYTRKKGDDGFRYRLAN